MEHAPDTYADPLGGSDPLAHWGFVYDEEYTWVTGEFVLATDGTVYRRMGGSSTGADGTTWRFGPWSEMDAWTPQTDPTAALEALKLRGYGVSEASPTPVNQPASGSYPGYPDAATYL